MIAKLKDWLQRHPKEYELLRYLFAGGVTTLLSMLISYGGYFVLADRPPMQGNLLRWVIDSIGAATKPQMSAANAVSWVISVLFAFWINRVMVFCAEKTTKAGIVRELAQFAGGRLVSFLLFEQGMMLLLKTMGVHNILNRFIVLMFVMVFNYVVSKFWIFKKKDEQ